MFMGPEYDSLYEWMTGVPWNHPADFVTVNELTSPSSDIRTS